jgi:hypothetical protein
VALLGIMFCRLLLYLLLQEPAQGSDVMNGTFQIVGHRMHNRFLGIVYFFESGFNGFPSGYIFEDGIAQRISAILEQNGSHRAPDPRAVFPDKHGFKAKTGNLFAP